MLSRAPPRGAGDRRARRDRARRKARDFVLASDSEPGLANRRFAASVFAIGGRTVEGFLDAVLEMHDVGDLPPVVPVLHPSYRDVWAARLGYDDGAAYERAVADRLHEVLDSSDE